MATEVSNVDVVVYALYRLGGAEAVVDTEDVALECYRLAPERFSWRKLPQYPDSETARIALSDAKKVRNGRLVKGDENRGWLLTTAGIDRTRVVQSKLSDSGGDAQLHVSDHQDSRRMLSELERHPAFLKFVRSSNCDDVAWHEFTDFLRCLVDTSPTKIVDRVEAYRVQAHDAGRTRILDFLDDGERRFHERLGK